MGSTHETGRENGPPFRKRGRMEGRDRRGGTEDPPPEDGWVRFNGRVGVPRKGRSRKVEANPKGKGKGTGSIEWDRSLGQPRTHDPEIETERIGLAGTIRPRIVTPPRFHRSDTQRKETGRPIPPNSLRPWNPSKT